ncbi:hypothetical protein KSP40_PGU019443 [Platanthera guangdongensis]|uniref:Uncharacterized protein n=1 Tax=Platanthera guangdongensis TaxID=2320717 RepID=A0ABR2MGB7_9ASPA
MLCYLLLEKSQVLKTIAGDFDPFLIHGLPEPVEAIKAQVALWTDTPGWEKIREDFLAAEESARSILTNTFEELELSVLEKYREETGKKQVQRNGICG